VNLENVPEDLDRPGLAVLPWRQIRMLPLLEHGDHESLKWALGVPHPLRHPVALAESLGAQFDKGRDAGHGAAVSHASRVERTFGNWQGPDYINCPGGYLA
jgi:hypothetical protein